MSNRIIPNFLPPTYDFTTEEDDTEEEHDKGSFALSVLCGVVLCLAFCRLMGSDVNVSFKLSVSKSKNKS